MPDENKRDKERSKISLRIGDVQVELEGTYDNIKKLMDKDLVNFTKELEKTTDQLPPSTEITTKVTPKAPETTPKAPEVTLRAKTVPPPSKPSVASATPSEPPRTPTIGKKTGKIRNIYCNGKHVLSMRATDGLFTLKIEGAKRLHNYFKSPNLRVIIKKDAIPFVKDGKSVFSKFVIDCDDNLRPYDECIVVDENDNFLGAGRCLLNKIEMLSFNYGMAVKVREHIK